MPRTRRAVAALILAALALVPAGCAALDLTDGTDADTTSGSPTDGSAPDDAGSDVGTGTDADTGTGTDDVVGLPAVGCGELEQLLGPLLEGLVENEEARQSDAETVYCAWVPVEERLDDVRLWSAELTVGDPDVPDVEAAAEFGLEYLTDPRLDPHGGVILWTPTGGDTVVGGGVGTVFVPGLEITLGSGGFGKETGLTLDTLVTFAVEVLALSAS